jgi:ATP-binding cassette subfamily B protein
MSFYRSLGGMVRSHGLAHEEFGADRDRPPLTLDATLLGRAFRTFLPYRWASLMILISIGLTSAIGLVSPLLVRAILDRAIPERRLSLLYLLVLGLVAVPLVTGLLGVLQNYWSTRISQNIVFDLRLALFRKLQSLSLRFFVTTRSGEILSRLNHDTGAVSGIVLNTLIGIVTHLFTVTATLVVLFAMDARLAVLACLIVPLFLFPLRRAGALRRTLSRQTQEKQAELQGATQDVLNVGGFVLMRLFGQMDYEAARFETGNRAVFDLQLRQTMVGRWLFLFLGTVAAGGPALIYAFGGRRLILSAPGETSLTVGTIIAFVAYLSNLYRPVAHLANIYVDIQGALAIFARIFEYLDLQPDVVERPGARVLPPVQGEIRFENVTFSYRQSHRPALENVSFVIPAGRLAALVGPSGAGKTTITYLLPRFYDPQEGTIRLDGMDLREVTLDSLAAQIGMVTQETFLFHATVRENLLYARPNATEQELIEAARAARILEVIERLPQGFDTRVGERGFKLSGGEKQRLSIARAILKNPRLLILDEATSSLDSESEAAIQAALAPLMKGRTTLVIAHRLSTVLAADVILVLERGRLIEQGRHEELLARGGLYARLFETQFRHATAA